MTRKDVLFFSFTGVFLATAFVTLGGIVGIFQISGALLNILVPALLVETAAALIGLFRRTDFFVSGGNHDRPAVRRLVRQLCNDLEDRFRPDVIVGIPRGGLAVAALLAKAIEERPTVPVLSLWPHPGFDNTVNRRIGGAIKGLGVPGEQVHVLVVDDIARSGRTLDGARNYLMKYLDPPDFLIETAALSYYEGQYSGAVRPTFFVDRPRTSIKDVGGDVEPMDS